MCKSQNSYIFCYFQASNPFGTPHRSVFDISSSNTSTTVTNNPFGEQQPARGPPMNQMGNVSGFTQPQPMSAQLQSPMMPVAPMYQPQPQMHSNNPFL